MTTEAIATTGPSEAMALPSPVFRGAQMVRALADYRELQKALDESMPDQIMQLAGKTFRKKGYWRAIRVAFNLTVECEREAREVLGTLDDGTDNYVYSAVYRATTTGGVSVTGDGTCAAAEKQRGRMDATEHNVRSHAHTRAFNRAVSNLVGFGEVSAEEVEREEHGTTAIETKERRADGTARVVKVEESSGTSKAGQPWKRYTVHFDDGRAGSTFNADLRELAQQALADRALVVATVEKKGQHTNLTALAPAPPPPPPAQAADLETTIDAADRKKVWQVAHAHGWSEDQVRALLATQGLAETAQITTGAFLALLQRLKAGPPTEPTAA